MIVFQTRNQIENNTILITFFYWIELFFLWNVLLLLLLLVVVFLSCVNEGRKDNFLVFLFEGQKKGLVHNKPIKTYVSSKENPWGWHGLHCNSKKKQKSSYWTLTKSLKKSPVTRPKSNSVLNFKVTNDFIQVFFLNVFSFVPFSR